MTYRDEAQQHLVAELRKVPQYNEIYIEKDFNGFTRPYFNLHEKLDLLEGIVNKAKSIDVSAALPLYLDDFTDFENYKVKLWGQKLDLFLYISKDMVVPKFDCYKSNNYNIKVPYVSIESYASDISQMFMYNDNITEIDIITENTVQANSTFSECSNINTIRGRINSKDKIGDRASSIFYRSFNTAKRVNISNFLCYMKDLSNAFSFSNISNPYFFKNWDFVIKAPLLFNNCDNIEKLDSKVFPSNLINTDYSFVECINLKEISGNWGPGANKNGFEIPEFANSERMFAECNNLKLIKNLKLSKTDNNELFYRCYNLKEVYNLQLNGIFTNIFKKCHVNESWKIWLPTEIETSKLPAYNKDNFLGACISHDKLKTFYVDINSVTIDGVQEPDIEKRKKQYEDILNPNRDFIFKFISLPKPTPQEPPVTTPIVVSNDNGHCVFKNTAVYYK